MTESEWIHSEDPIALAEFAHGKVDTHRFRFLAAQWVTRILGACPGFELPWLDAFVEWVEHNGPHPQSVCQEAEYVPLVYWSNAGQSAISCAKAIRAEDPMMAAAYAGHAARHGLRRQPEPDFNKTHRGRSAKKRREAEAEENRWRAEQRSLQSLRLRQFCAEFRDVAGFPFRPTLFDPSWRSSSAVPIAKAMYDSRDFSAAPILADALQDAGCAEPEILNHLRAESVHVRGCWVVDALLPTQTQSH